MTPTEAAQKQEPGEVEGPLTALGAVLHMSEQQRSDKDNIFLSMLESAPPEAFLKLSDVFGSEIAASLSSALAVQAETREAMAAIIMHFDAVTSVVAKSKKRGKASNEGVPEAAPASKAPKHSAAAAAAQVPEPAPGNRTFTRRELQAANSDAPAQVTQEMWEKQSD